MAYNIVSTTTPN